MAVIHNEDTPVTTKRMGLGRPLMTLSIALAFIASLLPMVSATTGGFRFGDRLQNRHHKEVRRITLASIKTARRARANHASTRLMRHRIAKDDKHRDLIDDAPLDDDAAEEEQVQEWETEEVALGRKRLGEHRRLKAEKDKRIVEIQRQLQANREEQLRVERLLDAVEDKHGFQRKVSNDGVQVANETNSEGLAGMMVTMWQEMREFGSPMYKEGLKRLKEKLQSQEEVIEDNLTKAENAPLSLNITWK